MRRTILSLLLVAVVMPGCVTYRPKPMTPDELLPLAKIQENDDVRVAAYVPGPSEARDLFGASLDKYDVQPVWFKIENKSDKPLLFIHRSVDPDYFTPEEAARRSRIRIFRHGRLLSLPAVLMLPLNIPKTIYANHEMRNEFARQGLRRSMVAPGAALSGYIFTHFDQGTKGVKVGYLGKNGEGEVHLFTEVPGIRQDYKDAIAKNVFRTDEIKDLNAEDLKHYLEKMACCVTNKKGNKNGDPMNLVLVGDLPAILNAFAIAGWDETESLSFKVAMKTLKAFFLGSSYAYRYSPVSDLYHLGRKHDVALQNIREDIHSRQHLRLWQTPMRFNAKTVWVGQVSRDIGIKLTTKSWYFVTHRIDSDLDEARANVLGDILSVKRVASVGLVRGVGVSDEKNPRQNLTGDTYFTDGLRLVAEVSDLPVKMLQSLWNLPDEQPSVS